ncbi:MAG TPA: hypothetical protein PKK12_10335 [Candidatus Aminicenantes bacterium]|nr:hypothetical protein [Candidatus Aminicenantes bacterium]
MTLAGMALCWLWLCQPALPASEAPVPLEPARLVEVMRLEFCHRVAAIHVGNREVEHDYLSRQGYRQIASRLAGITQPEAFLLELLATTSPDPAENGFREIAGRFAEGMALEVFDSLQGELDQLTRRRDRLESFAAKSPPLGPEDRLALLAELETSARDVRQLAEAGKWLALAARKADPFEQFSVLRGHLLRMPVHRGLTVVFDLGARYEKVYPIVPLFLSAFRQGSQELVEEAQRVLPLLP